MHAAELVLWPFLEEAPFASAMQSGLDLTHNASIKTEKTWHRCKRDFCRARSPVKLGRMTE
jgi:hypothetical protein